jgi:hypothetical protein
MNLKNPAYCTYLQFYQKQFSSAYRHLVNAKHDKNPPLEVVWGGIDKSLRHLANSCESDQSEKIDINLELALDTLKEDTYTCYKITTISINDELKSVCKNLVKAQYCITKYNDFNEEYNLFIKLCQEAKEWEDRKTDIGCKAAIKAYEDAIKLGKKLKSEIDPTKKEYYEQNIENKRADTLQKEAPSLIQILPSQILQHRKALVYLLGVILSGITFFMREFIIAGLQGFFQNTAIPYIQQLIHLLYPF